MSGKLPSWSRSTGCPEGTIDAQEAMINDQGYNELQAAVAQEVAFRQADPETQAVAREFYGMGGTQGELLGAILNESVGLPVVQQRIQAAQVASQARVQGFGDLTRQEAEELAGQGVDVDVARQTFGLLSRSEQLTRDFTRAELLSLAAGEAPATQRLEEARQEAQAVFTGGGGFAGGVAGQVWHSSPMPFIVFAVGLLVSAALVGLALYDPQ